MNRCVLNIFGLLLALCLGISAVAFADVPDPSGQRRPVRPPAIEQYYIYREAEFSSDGKYTINIYYEAPLGAEVEYSLKDQDGNIVKQDVASSNEKYGSFALVFDKPAAGETRTYLLETFCYKDKVKTPFGLKKMKERQLFSTFNQIYSIVCDKHGYVEVDRN